MLNNKLLNLKKLNNKEIEALRKQISASDFITVETSCKTLPRKILTTKGILDIVGDFEEECNKQSSISNTYAFGRMNCFRNNWYLNQESYQIFLNIVIMFFINNRNILLDYLNSKYTLLNLTLDDITYSSIKKQLKKLNTTEKMLNKKNNKRKKGNIYISKNNDVFLVTKEQKIYLLKENMNETRRNISKFKLRGNGLFHKDERRTFSTVSI